MKISELIKGLQATLKHEGDIECHTYEGGEIHDNYLPYRVHKSVKYPKILVLHP